MLKTKPNRLENTKKNVDYIESLRPIYIVACWVHYGVRQYYFSGYYKEINNIIVPLVWDYDDCNGTDDAYFLRPIIYTTTGWITSWTFDKDAADREAARLEQALINKKE